MKDGILEALSTHTHFFRGEEELDAAVAVLAERAAAGRAPRLWSAGCSMGAEPYTLAILCAERAIDAIIHATDLNPDALATARAARYPEIALRHTPDHLLERHFERRGADYVVSPDIVRRVTFELGDLRTDPLPFAPVEDGLGWDVIVCRNVLIYYDVDTAGALAARLARALAPGGVLIVGSADSLAFRAAEPLHIAQRNGVTSYTFSWSRAATSEPRAPGRDTLEPPISVVECNVWTVPAAAPPERPGAAPPSVFEATLAVGCRRLASHAWDEAEAALLKAQHADPLAPEPPLYLGVLRRKQGRFDEAFAHLRRAAFLSPDCWTASYLLAGAWERLGDRARARLELERTLKTLERAGAAAARPIGADLAGVAFDPIELARACRQRLGR